MNNIVMLSQRILFVFIVSIMNVGYASEEDLETLLSSHESWLLQAEECPADVMPLIEKESDYKEEMCHQSVANCLSACEKGNAEFCYNAALKVQTFKDKKLVKYEQALFLKACKLGSISACTNRAAGMQKNQGKAALLCSVKTYRKACEFEDPWACTMYAYHLASGSGVEKNLESAIQVMSQSCKYEEEDEACRSAKALLQKINIMQDR